MKPLSHILQLVSMRKVDQTTWYMHRWYICTKSWQGISPRSRLQLSVAVNAEITASSSCETVVKVKWSPETLAREVAKWRRGDVFTKTLTHSACFSHVIWSMISCMYRLERKGEMTAISCIGLGLDMFKVCSRIFWGLQCHLNWDCDTAR